MLSRGEKKCYRNYKGKTGLFKIVSIIFLLSGVPVTCCFLRGRWRRITAAVAYYKIDKLTIVNFSIILSDLPLASQFSEDIHAYSKRKGCLVV